MSIWYCIMQIFNDIYSPEKHENLNHVWQHYCGFDNFVFLLINLYLLFFYILCHWINNIKWMFIFWPTTLKWPLCYWRQRFLMLCEILRHNTTNQNIYICLTTFKHAFEIVRLRKVPPKKCIIKFILFHFKIKTYSIWSSIIVNYIYCFSTKNDSMIWL